MEVQGDLSQIRKFLIQLRAERYIRIEHMEIQDDLPLIQESAFEIAGY